MKGSSFFAIIAITLGMAAPATAAQSDPEIIIYRFPGVRDSGAGAGSGAVTAFHCTNFSGATETIRYVTRTNNGALTTNMTISIPHLSTVTTATSGLVAYTLDLALNTGILHQGTTAIAATSINIICTAMTVDSNAFDPVGVALRGIRFAPVPGSQE